jgi:hypothetical protein
MTKENWLALIRRIQTHLSTDYVGILDSGKLRLGTVQKMLSLCLKFYWRAGEVTKRPFWPPLDRQVVKAARKSLESRDRDISWKKLDDQEQYVRMMRAIEKFAVEQKCFIGSSEWEYDIWKTNDEI